MDHGGPRRANRSYEPRGSLIPNTLAQYPLDNESMHKGAVDQPASPPAIANRGYLASSSALFAIFRYLAARCPAFNHSSLDSMHQPPRSGLDEPGNPWFNDKHVVYRIFSSKLLGTEAGRGFPSSPPKWPSPNGDVQIRWPYTNKPSCGAEPLRCRFFCFRIPSRQGEPV